MAWRMRPTDARGSVMRIEWRMDESRRVDWLRLSELWSSVRCVRRATSTVEFTPKLDPTDITTRENAGERERVGERAVLNVASEGRDVVWVESDELAGERASSSSQLTSPPHPVHRPFRWESRPLLFDTQQDLTGTRSLRCFLRPCCLTRSLPRAGRRGPSPPAHGRW